MFYRKSICNGVNLGIILFTLQLALSNLSVIKVQIQHVVN